MLRASGAASTCIGHAVRHPALCTSGRPTPTAPRNLRSGRTNYGRWRWSFSRRTGPRVVAVSRADEYRRHAQQCLEMARTFGDHGARVTLAHMAQAWLRVADNCQDAKKIRPAMQQQQQIQPKDDGKKD